MFFCGGWRLPCRDIRLFEKYCEMLQGFFLPAGNGLLGYAKGLCTLALRLIENEETDKNLLLRFWQCPQQRSQQQGFAGSFFKARQTAFENVPFVFFGITGDDFMLPMMPFFFEQGSEVTIDFCLQIAGKGNAGMLIVATDRFQKAQGSRGKGIFGDCPDMGLTGRFF